jgi:predicted TIM-barrel fold metal-dependent hydrolase
MSEEFLVVDFHVHCFPDDLAERALTRLSAAPSGKQIKYYTGGTISDLQCSMEQAGVSVAVVQPVATRPQQVRKINDWAAAHQSSSIVFFASMHPDLPDWKEEIRRIKEQGFRGIKLHPDYQNFFVDDPRLFPLYENVFQEGLWILFHAGVDIGLLPPYHCTPKRLASLLKLFPGARIIAAHMGGYLCWDEVEEHLLGREIYFDTSYSFDVLGPEKMVRLICEHGPEKILFGTDSPWTDQKREVQKFRNLELPLQVKEKVLGLNAVSLLALQR